MVNIDLELKPVDMCECWECGEVFPADEVINDLCPKHQHLFNEEA
jgi:hypothetical protein